MEDASKTSDEPTLEVSRLPFVSSMSVQSWLEVSCLERCERYLHMQSTPLSSPGTCGKGFS